ncbi:MAG: type III toxin-antitoxin system ToxN/AbiQ family toxin [Lachnospiraceae bacterium]|nr:type III toxin-antitoxin system ToxN/AbiQ family toxin [Lachnospiraceae bacterium]
MLLRHQYRDIVKDFENIKKNALKLYMVCTKPEKELNTYQKRVKSRCCDFIKLEEAAKIFTEKHF